MKLRTILIGAGVVVVLVGLYALANPGMVGGRGTLELNMIPRDSTITVDGQKVEGPSIRLKPGSHQVVMTRDGFKEKTVNVTIKQGELTKQSVELVANDDATYQAWAKAHPDEAAIGEGFTGIKLGQEGKVITKDNPILQLLPYIGNGYRIDFGKSKLHPEDDRAVALYVSGNAQGRTKALNWIRANGYDPAAYEIIYQ